MRLQLGLGAYQSASVPFAAQTCINLYAAVAQAEALSEYALFRSPGIPQFSTVGSKPSRGATAMSGVYYTVSGTTLYSVDAFGAKTTLGTVTGTVRVVMAHNGDKLCIVVPGGSAFVFIASTSTFSQITDPDYVTSDTVRFKDGYYIFTATSGTTWFVSALNDPTSIDALDFGSAELSPDRIVGVHTNYDEVLILGSETIERFQNVGGSGFPWVRISGASYEKGVHSKYSTIQWEGSSYFIGGGVNEKTAVFRAGSSGEPIRVSTDAIEHSIQQFTNAEIGESFSYSYSSEGSSFVGFTFRSVNITSRTFEYNVTASELAGRKVWQEHQTGVNPNAWRVASVNFVYGKFLVSDSIDGRLGYLDSDTYTEYGNTILREKTLSPFGGEGKPVYVSRLELFADAGQGLVSGQGSDPKVMLSYSDDGARTWKNELWRSLGKIGEYFRQPTWLRLGRIPRYRVWRLQVTDPVKVTFYKLELEVVRGR